MKVTEVAQAIGWRKTHDKTGWVASNGYEYCQIPNTFRELSETLDRSQKEDYLECLVCVVLPHFPKFEGVYELPPVELVALLEATETQREKAFRNFLENAYYATPVRATDEAQ